MRRAAMLLALAVAACTAPPLALPDDSLSRATTCTAVRALELRAGKNGDGPLSFAGFTEILHFGMILAAEDSVAVDLRRLMMVSHRAPIVMEELADENWASLIEPCNAAFPETQRLAPGLPSDPYEAGLTCFGLADFIVKTAVDYPADRLRVAGLGDRALAAAQPMLRVRARADDEARRIASGYTARGFKLGRPAPLLEQCERRFPTAP